MAIGQTSHQAVGYLLAHIAGAENDPLRIVITKTEDRFREVESIRHVDIQRRQIYLPANADDGPIAAMDFHVRIAAVDDLRRHVAILVSNGDRHDATRV